MAVEKESSVDFIPETIEEEYALLAEIGRAHV